uniref:Uncharacterized protein LOC104215482 n=1 Tax=Nicotiana sylvestris TaxID=4096 RepID=A0A1U7VNX3_NICSY|nr:PREDICTED: uncharacterized protein LOC104215482 [Nicotiana sylvestris]
MTDLNPKSKNPKSTRVHPNKPSPISRSKHVLVSRQISSSMDNRLMTVKGSLSSSKGLFKFMRDFAEAEDPLLVQLRYVSGFKFIS